MDRPNNNYSVVKVLQFSIPLIVSSFGHNFMSSCGRLMLASYSLKSMNAVIATSTLLFIFEYGLTNITLTSEVYAGQYNGARQYKLIPIACWQMLYFALLCSLVYVPIALFAGEFLLSVEYYPIVKDYFRVLMCFTIMVPMTSAIKGFFIGTKQTKIISVNAIINNFLNIVLSYALIFGIDGIVPASGIMGMAISIVICVSLEFIITMGVFLSKKYNDIYFTRSYKFNKRVFINCLKLGAPSSIGLVLDIAGGYFIQLLLVKYTLNYVSSHNIGLNVIAFLTFFISSMNKSTSALAANILGAGLYDELPKLFKSSLIIFLIFSSTSLGITIIFPNEIARLFTNDENVIRLSAQTLPWTGVCIMFSGIGWMICGIIIAGGDTKFVMYANGLVIWLFRILPTFILLHIGVDYCALGWMISAISSIIYCLICYWRYRSGKWIKLQLAS